MDKWINKSLILLSWWVKVGWWRHKWTFNCVLLSIVTLCRFKVVNRVLDSAQKLPTFVLFREQKFDIVRSFCQNEIDQSQILHSSASFSNKFGQIIKLRGDFFKSLLHNLFVLFPEILSHFTIDIIEKTKNWFYLDWILNILPEQFFFIRLADNIFLNGRWFRQFKAAINQIRDIGESKPNTFLILLEPSISAAVCLILPG